MINSSSKSQLIDGWYKIDLQGSSSFELDLKLSALSGKDAEASKHPAFVAISDAPGFNSKTRTQKFDEAKPITIERSDGPVYIQYPVEKQYLVRLTQKF